MFRIPAFHQMNLGFEEACAMLRGYAGQDTLIGAMEAVQQLWEDHAQRDAGHDDRFFETWAYELNAYNAVFTQMHDLLGEA